MLCSNAGPYVWNEGRLQMETRPGKHSLFLSYKEARRHADWLREMKGQFLSRRQELKEVTSRYIKMGSWVSPKAREK